MAAVLASASGSFADSKEQGVVVGDFVVGGYRSGVQMTVTNAGGSSGHVCGPDTLLAVPHTCGQRVTVSGSNFVNSIADAVISSVDLYWVDEPFLVASLGSPDGRAEAEEARLCKDKGVPLGSSSVSGGAFSVTPMVTVPPTAEMTGDGTIRLGATTAATGKFWYGANAVCAVWKHFTDGLSHDSSTGARYTISPA